MVDGIHGALGRFVPARVTVGLKDDHADVSNHKIMDENV